MSKSISIGFVTYNPNKKLLNRIDEVISCGFSVYVFDNSPENSCIRDALNNTRGVKYVTCGKNVGLGVGISTICAQAYYDCQPALLFFDQDTIFNSETLNCIEEYYSKNSGAISDYSAIVFNSRNYRKIDADQRACFRDVRMAINSGSLFILENAKKLNWHNEKYFVDCVDYEFCLNSAKSNLKIGEYSCTPGFDHSAEQDDTSYRIFGKIYSMRAYPISRIVDTIAASVKLIFESVWCGQIRFGTRILRLCAIYIAIQLLVRVMKLTQREKVLN